MIYIRRCESCKEIYEIVLPAAESDKVINCKMCLQPTERVYTAPRINVSKTFTPGYNPAFGKVINTQHELRETIKRMNAEKGMDIQEVGNDKQESIKPTYKSYDDDLVDTIRI